MQDSVDRFLDALEADSAFSGNTVSAYRIDLKQFVEYMQEQLNIGSWSEVEPTHLTSHLLHLREREYASSTVARKTAAVKSFFGFLRREGELRTNPSTSLSSPRVDKYVPKPMTEREIQKLLLAPAGDTAPESIRDSAMLHVLYSTGMRVSELVTLDLDDVDMDAGTVCCTGKQNRRRSIDASPEAVRALRIYLETARPAIVRESDEQALFLNHRGSRLTRQGFWLILKGHSERAGFDNITPHTLRHSFATHQITHGRDLADVQRILGHVSISTTQIYQRLAQEHADGRVADPNSGGTAEEPVDSLAKPVSSDD
ncbi:MAG TPA: tyrosine recombinase [Thermomicrobiales bacterium]|nr:tyrosine recombinase [Thermomicrobiales bacterium]